ncbi:BAG domain-containing protein Samui-like [Ostrinia nubilalis]|uniref:BAG domain-containing protein Samui-like n=1 Tax=Ostrinia nubilalis TaxID=29057 RepID=UPI00308262D7
MRSPSPARRSPSPARRSPERFERPERSDRERPDRERADRERRHRPDTAPAPRTHDEESEYRRRVREQESLRERVLRAKEVRRRRNAAALHKQLQERERERQGLDKDKDNHKESKPEPPSVPDRPAEPDSQPDTTRKSPDKPAPKPDKVEKIRERSPVKDDSAEVNSTCENLTPPRPPSPERALTPPLPEPKKDNKYDSDDDLDLILGDIDGILSDDEDTGRFKDKDKPAKYQEDLDLILGDIDGILSDDEDTGRFKDKDKPAKYVTIIFILKMWVVPTRWTDDLIKEYLDLILEDIDGILSDDEDTGRFKDKDKPAKAEPAKPAVDLRARIGAGASVPARRQKIVFHEKKKEKSPPRRAVVTSSTKADNSESDKKSKQVKPKPDASTNKSRQRITFDSKEDKEKEKDDDKKQSFPNRRVILQRKTQPTKDSKSVFSRIETKTDPTKPHPGIFSRAVRTAIGSDTRIVIKKHEEPHVEFESDSDLDEDKLLDEEVGNVADVTNLPHGMTDTRLKTLAGNDVQSLSLDKEERRAKITFKTTVAAETFKKKFNNKMVAASRLTVSLR